jgi:hypothetical protein
MKFCCAGKRLQNLKAEYSQLLAILKSYIYPASITKKENFPG